MSAALEVIMGAAFLAATAAWLGIVRFSALPPRTHAGALMGAVWLALGMLLATTNAPARAVFQADELQFLLAAAIGGGALPAYLPSRFGFGARVAIAGFALLFLQVLHAREITVASGLDGWSELAAVMLAPFLLVALPQAVAGWTIEDRRLGLRATLQVLLCLAILLWLLPALIFAGFDQPRGWQPLRARSAGSQALWLTPLLIPLLVIALATRQFVAEGGGTPFPYDPPRRLVTGGIYAYVANPMQIGAVLLIAWWGIALASLWVVIAAGVACALFQFFDSVCGGSSNAAVPGPALDTYRRNVPKWWPRATPWRAPA